MNGLSIINNSSILSKDDLGKIGKLLPEMNDVMLKAQVFRTRTEMEVSVLNDIRFPTPDSKYWQAVREQKVHYTELVMLSYEYRKVAIEIKKLERDLKKESDELEAELLKIEIDKLTFIQKQNEIIARDRIRELEEWHDIKKGLVPKLVYSLNDVGDHQLVSYTLEFIREAMIMPPTISQPEKQNLLGKLQSSIRVVREKGLENKLKKQLTEIEKKFYDQIL